MTGPLLNNRYRIVKTLKQSPVSKTFEAEDTQAPAFMRCLLQQFWPASPGVQSASQLSDLQAKFSQQVADLKSASLRHSQLPDVYADFSEQGSFYLVQEWIEGMPVARKATSLWSEGKVSDLLNSALDALCPLHSHNIIHQNLSPGTLIIRSADQRPCLTEPGQFAALMKTPSAATLAASKTVVTPKTQGFIAPEQTIGNLVLSSDIYSLGLISIYLLTGKTPFKIPADSNNGRLLWKQFAPNVSDRFAGILTRAIHPNPKIRFQTAPEMLSTLGIPTASLAAKPIPAPTSATAPTVVRTSAPSYSPPPNAPATPPPAISPQPNSDATEVSLPAASPAASPPYKPSAGVAAVSPQAAPPQASAATPVAPTPPAPNRYYNPSPASNPSTTSRSFWASPWLKWGALGAGGFVFIAVLATAAFTLLSGSNSVPLIDASSPESLEEEIAQLEDTVASNPDDEASQVKLIEAYTQGGEIEPAANIIDLLLEEDSGNVDALYQKGRIQFYLSNYEPAIETLEQALDSDDGHAASRILLGRAYQEIGDYDSAEQQFNIAIDNREQRGEGYLYLSYLENLRGETRAALEAVNNASRHLKGSERIKLYTQLSTLSFDLRDTAQAEEHWEAAIALTPQNPEHYVLQSISRFFLGDGEGALADIETALSINPQFTEAHVMESLIYLNQGDIEPATTAIDKAVAIDEFSMSALKVIADVALSQPEPNLDFAFNAMSQALEVNPNNPHILSQRCNFFIAVREFDDAIADCDAAIAVNPNSIEAHSSRGQAYLAQLDFASAEKDFTRIIDINDAVGRPPDPAAYAQRAAARTGLQDVEGAKADLDKALEINSEG
ncbi:MAG: tetratricopeptide repeat protein [Cyanobacteria bacterium J06627_28]